MMLKTRYYFVYISPVGSPIYDSTSEPNGIFIMQE